MPKHVPVPTPTRRPARRQKPLKEIVMGVVKEFVGSALTVLSIFGVRKLVELLLGGQLLWDVLPIKYCADTVDAAVFLRFIWQVFRTFND
jgi:hypothetical protein